MSRSRGGAWKQGPRKKIVAILEEHQDGRKLVRFECGHEVVIRSHSPNHGRCGECPQVEESS